MLSLCNHTDTVLLSLGIVTKELLDDSNDIVIQKSIRAEFVPLHRRSLTSSFSFGHQPKALFPVNEGCFNVLNWPGPRGVDWSSATLGKRLIVGRLRCKLPAEG
jgi:hypothetical protein